MSSVRMQTLLSLQSLQLILLFAVSGLGVIQDEFARRDVDPGYESYTHSRCNNPPDTNAAERQGHWELGYSLGS